MSPVLSLERVLGLMQHTRRFRKRSSNSTHRSGLNDYTSTSGLKFLTTTFFSINKKFHLLHEKLLKSGISCIIHKLLNHRYFPSYLHHHKLSICQYKCKNFRQQQQYNAFLSQMTSLLHQYVPLGLKKVPLRIGKEKPTLSL